MPKASRRRTIAVGRIVAAHGIRGEVKVEPYTEFLERFDPGRRLCVAGGELTVESRRPQGQRLIVKFKEVADRSAAEGLQWLVLETEEDLEPALGEHEYLTRDLLGMRVVDEHGTVLGEVENVLPYPAHDLIVVGELLIPAVKEFVVSVDVRARRMVVRLIPGMHEGDA